MGCQNVFSGTLMVKEIFSSQEYQTSKYQKTNKLIEFSILDLVKNSDLFIDLGSISLFFSELKIDGTQMRLMVPKCVLTTHFAKAVVSSLHVESIQFLKPPHI